MTPDLSTVITVLVGTVLPWLTGRVTRTTAHPGLRGVTLVVLAALTSVLTDLGTALASGTTFNMWAVLLHATWSYALGQALHSGIYRHSAIYQRNAATGGFIGPVVTSERTP